MANEKRKAFYGNKPVFVKNAVGFVGSWLVSWLVRYKAEVYIDKSGAENSWLYWGGFDKLCKFDPPHGVLTFDPNVGLHCIFISDDKKGFGIGYEKVFGGGNFYCPNILIPEFTWEDYQNYGKTVFYVEDLCNLAIHQAMGSPEDDWVEFLGLQQGIYRTIDWWEEYHAG